MFIVQRSKFSINMATIPIQPVIPPIINAGAQAIGNRFWRQMKYTYGRNDSGYFQNFNYRGIESDITALAVIFDTNGWTWTVTPKDGGGLATLEAHAGFGGPSSVGTTYGAETPENIWELDPNEVDKSLLEADFPFTGTAPGLNSLTLSSQDTSEAVMKMSADSGGLWTRSPAISGVFPYFKMSDGTIYIFDGNDPAAQRPASLGAVVFVGLPKADYAPAFSFYSFLKRGFTNFPVEASIIRHTQLVSNQYAVAASFSNVNRLISSASMVSIEGAPGNLLFNVPTTPSPSQFIEAAGDLQYGWKKSRPAVTRLAQFKWRIVQHWQLGLWPIRAFGSVL